MTKEEKSLILALCIGDGYINNNNCLHIKHSLAQEEYVKWKHQILNKIFPVKRPNNLSYRESFDKRTGKTYKSVTTYKHNKYFRVLRKWMYRPDKQITRTLLNRLNPQGLAIWFMDDGNLRVKHSPVTGKVTSIQLVLALHSTKEQAELIQNYFEEVWGITWSIYKQKDKYLLGANTSNGNKFLDLIRSYVIPSMSYKVDINPRVLSPSITEGEDIV